MSDNDAAEKNVTGEDSENENDTVIILPESQRLDSVTGVVANISPHLIEEVFIADEYCCIPAEDRFPD